MNAPARDTWPAALRERPVCPHRKLPIPFVAEVGDDGVAHFTVLDNTRKIECHQGRLCAMCGYRMEHDVALIGDVVSLEPDGFFIEPPVHERCAELALGGLCPYLSGERVPRRPVEDGVMVIGSERDRLADIGRGTPKRPVIVAICRDYTPGMFAGDDGDAMIYRANGVRRVRLFGYAGGRATEARPPGPMEPPARLVRHQPRRKPRSKR